MDPSGSQAALVIDEVMTLVEPLRVASDAQPTPATLLRCLLVTPNQLRGDWLSASAHSEGWSTIVVHCSVVALREAIRQRFHLAVIDLSDDQRASERDALVADLQAGHIPLVVVCGVADDDQMEIRIRKLGVWSYLSGLDVSADLQFLFAEARTAAQQIDPTLRPCPTHATSDDP